jgi:hypothetical protein
MNSGWLWERSIYLGKDRDSCRNWVTRLNYLANCVVGCRVECYEDCVLCSKDDAGYVKGYFEAPSNPLDSEPQGDACALEQGPYHYKEHKRRASCYCWAPERRGFRAPYLSFPKTPKRRLLKQPYHPYSLPLRFRAQGRPQRSLFKCLRRSRVVWGDSRVVWT